MASPLNLFLLKILFSIFKKKIFLKKLNKQYSKY